ncbi:MAG: hypothetical protein EON58_12850 [Alphaproteobacteria bacterium]|nr:MAG: hypothetical protein EON58_12850 [Alphaproteobacteria bacterium]
MTRQLLGTYDLFDRHAKRAVDCELYEGIAANNVADFTHTWKPVFDKKRSELAAAGKITDELFRDFSLQDAHWEWPAKAAAVEASNDNLRSFAVECLGVTQGLMIAMPFGFAREPSQLDLPLTQVLLLSTAPWNRSKLIASPKYQGVGRLLLTAAISLSLEEEQAGRIGLHALSGAETWYRGSCGMTDLGFDADKQMTYFEMTQAQAQRFIS